MLVQETDVGELDLGPDRLVSHDGREGLADDGDRLVDSLVVHLDPRLRRFADAGPVAALEALFRRGARFTEEAVVLVEAVAHRSRDVGSKGHDRAMANIAAPAARSMRGRFGAPSH